ncbi:MAG: heavy-metal-associated domain-containing protein [Nitrospiraceae bacterium]
MIETTFQIEGMSCGHCVGQVQRALARLEGLSVCEVTVGQARVTYDPSAIEPKDIVEVVKEAGYEVCPAGRVA